MLIKIKEFLLVGLFIVFIMFINKQTVFVEVDMDGNYFVPAIKRNESGEQATLIAFKMVLENSEDVASDSEKVVAAFEAGTLDVVCVGIDGKETNQYVKLAGLAETAVEETTVTFEGALNVNEGLFKAATAGLKRHICKTSAQI